MGTKSSIDRHPDRERIVEMIGNGASGAEIARQYGVSQSAISRYKISRQTMLTQVLNQDADDPTEILGRLADLAESARITRKLADTSSSPQVRARAISAELAVLDRLTKLAITDTEIVRLTQAAGLMVKVIQALARTHPREVYAALSEHPELDDLREALKAQNRSTK
ncbi:hypothetical protein ACLD0U_04280 [Microbacterium sp. 2216-1]|uniref:hypothetical protein n=1 Tax=Microbacterium sp. 2216-1 TaxID=3390053 RepID=UPI0039754552